MGRFINADAFASTGQGLLGNNMFVYCNNNPVILYDSTGHWAKTIANPNASCFQDTVRAGGGGIAILYPLLNVTDAIGELADAFGNWLDDQKKAIADEVAKSLARSKTSHSDNVHEHHIVPQNDFRGLPAYIILQEVFPDSGVNDPRNLIQVSARIHVRLHTDLYYALVNNTVTIAYLSAGDNAARKEANVTAALAGMKIFIASLELL